MIELTIKKQLGDFRLDVAIRAPSEGILGLVGPSGSGKSTLFSCIAGLMRPDQGRIVVNGRTLFDDRTGEDLEPAARDVGVVFQDGLLFPHMSVAGNLSYGVRQRDDAYYESVVNVLGLSNLLKRRPANLSGGERQRVAIGRALLSKPGLLLLDEPLSALDPARKECLLDHLEAVRATTRIPMIYISHAPEEIRRLADRVLALRDGQLAELTTSSLVASQTRPRTIGENACAI